MVLRELLVRIKTVVDDTQLKSLNNQLDQAPTRVGRLRAALGRATDTFRRYRVAIGAAAVALGGLIAARAIRAFNTFRERIDDVAKAADRLGISAEAVQQLDFAAQQSGTSFATLERAARTLQKGLVDSIGRPNSPVTQALTDLGVAATNADGELRTFDDLLPDIADGLSRLENSTARAGLAQQLFGGRSVELLPLLTAGSEGIAELRRQFAESGAQISGQTADQVEEFNDTLNLLRQQIIGVAIPLAAELVPALISFVQAITPAIRAVGEFIARNELLIPILAGLTATLVAVVGVAFAPFLLTAAKVVLVVGAITSAVTLAVQIFKNWEFAIGFVKESFDSLTRSVANSPVGRFFGDIANRVGGFAANLTGAGPDLGAGPTTLAPATAGARSTTNNVNAPVNISFAPGTDRRVVNHAAEEFERVQNRIARQTQRQLLSNAP